MCKVSFCFKSSVEGSHYCQKHKCETKGCTKKRRFKKDYNTYSLYCDKCSCAYYSCNGKNVEGSRFCKEDKCEMCNESRSDCKEHAIIRCKCFNCHNYETISRCNVVQDYYCSKHTCVLPDCNTPTGYGLTPYCPEHAKEYCYFKIYSHIRCSNKASHKCFDLMAPRIEYGVCSECVDNTCQYKNEDGAFCSYRAKDKYCAIHESIMAELTCHECGEASKDCQDTHLHNGPYSRVVKICASCYAKAEGPPSYKSAMNENEKNVNDVSNSAIACA